MEECGEDAYGEWRDAPGCGYRRLAEWLNAPLAPWEVRDHQRVTERRKALLAGEIPA